MIPEIVKEFQSASSVSVLRANQEIQIIFPHKKTNHGEDIYELSPAHASWKLSEQCLFDKPKCQANGSSNVTL
jgi:hypothetical protein